MARSDSDTRQLLPDAVWKVTKPAIWSLDSSVEQVVLAMLRTMFTWLRTEHKKEGYRMAVQQLCWDDWDAMQLPFKKWIRRFNEQQLQLLQEKAAVCLVSSPPVKYNEVKHQLQERCMCVRGGNWLPCR